MYQPAAARPNLTLLGDRTPIDRRRYRRVLRFFAGVTAHIILWEIILRRVLGKSAVDQGRRQRIRGYARSFRKLAIDMGGVMIKLGQFVSARVDVMPPAIIEVLADLQDEVPPERLDDMLSVLESELGKPPDELFAEFDRNVQAAASLGQVYRARLKNGQRVVVKIQRPGIEVRVATDLAALRRVARWTLYWDLIRKRADVPALLDEFAATLWQELDYQSEADHAERFRALFANDMRVYIPAIYREVSTGRVITLEDVTSIKITDYAGIEAAGVSRGAAARTLLDLYLRMIFDYGFFHADPHPGNLFIYPLPPEAVEAMSGRLAAQPGQPFYVVFVDFGMVGTIGEEVKEGLRELLIAVGTRDAKRVLSAYKMLGVLLPSADTSRIEQAGQEALDTIWGRTVPEMAQMPRSEMRDFALKYRDLMYELPFQVPQNFIYLARAVGILSGICTGLDPQFNPWAQIAEYAQRLVQQETRRIGSRVIGQEVLRIGQVILALPRQTQDVLEKIQGGELQARVSADDDLKRNLHRLEVAVSGMTRAVVFASLLLAATILLVAGQQTAALLGFGFAGAAWLALAFRRRGS